MDVEERLRFNPNLIRSWFGGVVAVIDNITMLAVLLTGAALIRERERGTVEHLLVMPVTPFEIMTSKIWSMGLVVLVASALSVSSSCRACWRSRFMVRSSLPVRRGAIPVRRHVAGDVPGHLRPHDAAVRAADDSGVLPLQMLSGGSTPRESMPEWVQQIMLAAPTTHFVMLSQGILFRGAGLSAVWPQFLALALIGATFQHRAGPLPQDHRVDGMSGSWVVQHPTPGLQPAGRSCFLGLRTSNGGRGCLYFFFSSTPYSILPLSSRLATQGV